MDQPKPQKTIEEQVTEYAEASMSLDEIYTLLGETGDKSAFKKKYEGAYKLGVAKLRFKLNKALIEQATRKEPNKEVLKFAASSILGLRPVTSKDDVKPPASIKPAPRKRKRYEGGYAPKGKHNDPEDEFTYRVYRDAGKKAVVPPGLVPPKPPEEPSIDDPRDAQEPPETPNE